MSEYVKMEIPSWAAQNRIASDFPKGEKVLNLGCGPDYVDDEDWTNLDGDPNVKADTTWDLENGTLPYPNNSFDIIFASHILEHITNLVPLQKEFERVIKPGGRAYIVVPHYTSPCAWGDPTHVRAFSNQSFWHCYWPGIDRLSYQIVEMRPEEGDNSIWMFVTLFYRGE